ncbi:type II toxin-antitoxin system VapC family toxin [Microcystis aeruginosa]|uniref:tRNA(fMet)-specific endonuclease VapC n=1 Tax=Microcystis aeruginosa NIES-2521 TaxID=2303983 RepID=A0A5A5RV74_MICAE|nr:type II toxin-antitoxin system VapC family toxin [Microcystis aeruginosa]GCA78905.1 tRNA(fMet)-specific endonuclease VapC [Microcystis aeruginosa NIES-2521]
MNLRFLLDSNILSESLRPQPNTKVMEKLLEHQQEIATATVVLPELLFGCYRLPDSKKRKNIEEYLKETELILPLLSYDHKAAIWHAQERSRLVKLGKTPPFADGQIAAVAYVNQLILVTNNISDYREFQGLKIENWHY